MLTFTLVNSFLVTKNPENRKTINTDHCLTKATSVIYNPKTMGPGFLWGEKKKKTQKYISQNVKVKWKSKQPYIK